jgi:hypothetical protein
VAAPAGQAWGRGEEGYWRTSSEAGGGGGIRAAVVGSRRGSDRRHSKSKRDKRGERQLRPAARQP